MATRRGGFSTPSLNPFGFGAEGFGQYDIGDDLAELEVYRVEVAWGNGLATDEEYLAALRRSLDATDPNTQKRESAQNKLDDAVYRIGRSKAEEQGLDALIAFDQAAIAKMNPDNVRYRDVQQSLRSELAQRRSRDYGKLVDAYNAGETSTESLLAYVRNALGGLTEDDPDFDNWQGVQADLEERVRSERDSEVYQDYQQGRMKAPEFLAYLRARRDSFDTSSPKWDDWNDRLEDATEQVADQEQATADQAFFARYEEGKESDASYLTYLRNRIAGMDEDDPAKGEWQHRLNQASFRLAEDQLRFDVEKGKKPVGELMEFYRGYRATLNPGSAEWRQITRAMDVLARNGLGLGGRGGGTGNPSAAIGAPASAAKGGLLLPFEQAIAPERALDAVLPLLRVNPGAQKKDRDAAHAYFDLNFNALRDARMRGDEVWLFHDPRKPGQMVQQRNPDGSLVMHNGKPVMVPGSQYLTVSDQAFATLNLLEADYQMGLAQIALEDHDLKDYADALRRAATAEDDARLVSAQAIQRSNEAFFKAAEKGIESAMRAGDAATAINLILEVGERLQIELANPMLDDSRRTRLDALGEKIADNPLVSTFDPVSGRPSGGAIDQLASRLGRDGRYTHVELNPGWHHVLRIGSRGEADWGFEFDNAQDGSWEASHIKVATTYGTRVVQSEVKLDKAAINPSVRVRTDEGFIEAPIADVDYFAFVDEFGRFVRSYSLDGGRSWIRATPGMPAPIVEVNADLKRLSDGDGTWLVDATSEERVFSQNPDGSWGVVGEFLQQNPQAFGWMGQAEYNRRKADLGRFADRVGRTNTVRGPERHLGFEFGEELRAVQGISVGAPGMQMMVVETSPTGLVDLTPTRDELPKVRTRRPGDLDTYQDIQRAIMGANQSRGSRLIPKPEPGALGVGRTLVNAPDLSDFETRYIALRSQLPADTPPRLEGRSLRPTSPAVLRTSTSVTHPTLPPVPDLTPAPAPPPTLRSPSSTTVTPPALPPRQLISAPDLSREEVSYITRRPPPRPAPTPTRTATTPGRRAL